MNKENKETFRVGSCAETISGDLFRTGKNKREMLVFLNNIIDVFLSDFNSEVCYELFSNWIELEGDDIEPKYNNRIIESESESVLEYTMDGKNYIPSPRNIEQFVIDCERVWEISLYWDKNLVRRRFI